MQSWHKKIGFGEKKIYKMGNSVVDLQLRKMRYNKKWNYQPNKNLILYDNLMHYGDVKNISRIREGSFFSIYDASLIEGTYLKGYREPT